MSVRGWLVLDGWQGLIRREVQVIGETPKRYRIRALTRTRLAGRGRWLNPGQTVLVPKAAVRDNCQVCGGVKGGVPGNENHVNGMVVCDYCHGASRHA